jgi:hypothetical protein
LKKTIVDLGRRRLIQSLSSTALVLPFADILAMSAPLQQQDQAPQKIGPQERSYDAKLVPAPQGPKSPIEGTPLGVGFIDVVKQSGLDVTTIYGGVGSNKYLLETTGCGLAFYDYDNDGCLDLFLVNGWRLEGFAKGREPHCHLFKNNRDGTFTDVTIGSGLEHKTGWGQACCVGDYDNDGNDDLFVTGVTCPAASPKVAGVGSEASSCQAKKPSEESSDMISGRVRAIFFMVHLTSKGSPDSRMTAEKRSGIVERAAEAVAGSLF